MGMFIKICAYLTGIFLFAWSLGFIASVVRIIIFKLKKEEVPKELYKILNPLIIPNTFISGNEYKTSTKIIIHVLFIIGIIGLVLDGVTYTNIGSSSIGSFIERKEYSEYYYVNMFPEKSKDENYRVKAKIIATTDTEIYDDNSNNSSQRSIRVYYIEKAYFDNGDIITFYDSYGDSLELNKKVGIYDDNDNYWKIELTDKKAK